MRLFLVVAEVPFADEALALGVFDDALPVATELRVVRRQQLQASRHTVAEVVDRGPVAEHSLNIPVRRSRTEVHDLHVTHRGQLLKRFAKPEELAEPLVFLMSDESSFVTGAVIPAEAGHTTW